MKFLILCDMDGTLLNNNEEISEFTTNYIKNLAKEHYFCLISSSSYQRMLPVYNALELNTHIACKNGGLIINPNTNEKFVHAINKDDILVYFNEVKEKITSMFYKCEGDAYCYNFDPKYKVVMNIPSNIKINNGNYNDMKLSNSTNLYIICPVENDTFIEEYFSSKNLSVDCMGKDKKIAIYVITHLKALKHEALNFFKENYKFDKVISFGDSTRDLEMLKNSDIAYLMKNSSIKNSNIPLTDYSNKEDGVAKQLKKIIDQ